MMATVNGNARLARHVADIDDDGHHTGGGGGSLPWFDVTDVAYGATGDGSTDDTSAINAAVAALNTATAGVLYFPAGTYKVTSALTTITASGMVLGDGSASYDDAVHASQINFTSQTAVLFTISAKAFRFDKLAMVNTYAGTPSAGTSVLVDSSYLEARVDFDSCSFQGFYDNLDIKVGAQWSYRACFNIGPVRYGIRIRNTVNNDAGDWVISDSNFSAETYNSTSAIRIESSGGGKIIGCKVNTALDSKYFATGIDLAIPTGVTTSVLLISACSIENVTGDAILGTTTGTGRYAFVSILGCQVGLYSNNSGRAVKLSAASTGGFGSSGGLGAVVIDSSVFYTSGTARAAIELVNTDRVTLGDIQLQGFNARYTSSGDTNTTDGASVTLAGDVSGPSGTTSVDKVKGVTITDASTTGAVLTKTGSTAATWAIPSTPASGVTDHEHITNVVFSGDASTTVWELPAAPVDAMSIAVYVTGSRSIAWVLSGTLLTTLTFDSAPASASNNIVIDIVAATA